MLTQHPWRNHPDPVLDMVAVPDLTTDQLVQTTYTLLAAQVQTLAAEVTQLHTVLTEIRTHVTTLIGRVDPAARSVPIVPCLSPRQLVILRKVAEGKTNRQIGQELWMGTGTVKGDLALAMQELDVHTRAHAAVKAQQLGLLDTPPAASGPHHPW